MSFFICFSRSSTDGCGAFGGGGGAVGRGGGGVGGGLAELLARVLPAVLPAALPLPPPLLLAFAGSSRPANPFSRNSISSSPTDRPMSASSSARLFSRVPPELEARFCARAARRAAKLSCAARKNSAAQRSAARRSAIRRVQAV